MKLNLLIFFFTVLFCSLTNAQVVTLRDEKEQKTGDNFRKIPDYNDLYFWASHPLKHDNADSIPQFLLDEIRDTAADVFFIHPTSFTRNILAGWNADLDNEEINNQTDNRSILYQASIFNGSCRIFAPRYRQAHVKAFFVRNSKAAQDAFELAYEDISSAFQHYLENDNNGRPIIIAGHSQGAMHAIRLLNDHFAYKPLHKQLVCAYVVGWQIKKEDLKDLSFCTSPSQTGCMVGWRSYRKGTIDRIVKAEDGNSFCINPVTWTTSMQASLTDQHKGMMLKDFNKIYPQKISARVEPEAKILWVDLPGTLDESRGFMSNFHVADFNLFYMDVRKNVKLRIHEYQKKQHMP